MNRLRKLDSLALQFPFSFYGTLYSDSLGAGGQVYQCHYRIHNNDSLEQYLLLFCLKVETRTNGETNDRICQSHYGSLHEAQFERAKEDCEPGQRREIQQVEQIVIQSPTDRGAHRYDEHAEQAKAKHPVQGR